MPRYAIDTAASQLRARDTKSSSHRVRNAVVSGLTKTAQRDAFDDHRLVTLFERQDRLQSPAVVIAVEEPRQQNRCARSSPNPNCRLGPLSPNRLQRQPEFLNESNALRPFRNNFIPIRTPRNDIVASAMCITNACAGNANRLARSNPCGP